MKTYAPFSVLINVYKNDTPAYFIEALKSITEQTVRPNEIVVVVDGPVPNTIDNIIKNCEAKYSYKVIRIPLNVGLGEARRVGLENCSNKLIALMDADDISISNRFEKQLKCFEKNSNLSIVGGNIKEFIDSIDNVVGIRKVPQYDCEIKNYLKKRCPINNVTAMFKLADVKKAGGYIDWYCNEDYYLWIRMFQCGATFENIKESLVYVRVGKEMYYRRGGWKYFKSEFKLQRYMFHQNIISLFRFIVNIVIRLIVQIIMPVGVRRLVYEKYARKREE